MSISATKTKKPSPASKPELLDGVEVLRDISYINGSRPQSKPQSAQGLDLYLLPTNRSAVAGQPLPVIVYLHGGGWLHGDKTDPYCIQQCIRLAKDGYAAASINYRLSDAAIWPAQIYDCKAAIRCLRAYAGQFNLDPEHIGVWGTSSGGHLAAMLGTTNNLASLEGNEGNTNQPSTVQAVCDWYGPVDLVTLKPQVIKAHISRDILCAASWLIGGPINADNSAAVEASPVSYVSDKVPPFLIMHGDCDMVVPIAQSKELADTLKDKGAQAEFVVVSAYGHEFLGSDAEKQVLDFFDLHLKPQKDYSNLPQSGPCPKSTPVF